MAPEAFTPGQAVFVERCEGRRARGPAFLLAATVEKIGRRWVTIRYEGSPRRDRFDPADRQIDAGEFSPSDRVWLSPEECAEAARKAELWQQIRTLIEPPAELPLVELERFAALVASAAPAQ